MKNEEVPQSPFTALFDDPDLDKSRSIAKKEDRTVGSILREALRQYLNNRKRRGKS